MKILNALIWNGLIAMSVFAVSMPALADSDEVDVSVPGPKQPTGSLTIVGEPGSGQNGWANVFLCKTDDWDRIVKFGCSEIKDPMRYLNETFAVVPGTYLINYSNSKTYVKVTANQATQVRLKKLKVLPSTRNVTYSVFRDLSDPSMQDQMLKNVFVASGNESNFMVPSNYCGEDQPQNQKACKALQGNYYQELKDSFYRFGKDGTFSEFKFLSRDSEESRFSEPQRLYIGDPKPGEFMSVFPGTYGIEFKDHDIDDVQIQLGIKIN